MKRMIGRHLIEMNALRQDQVGLLLDEQRETAAAGVHSRLGEIAVRRGWVEADVVTAALHRQAREVMEESDAITVLLGLGWINAAQAEEARRRAAGSGETADEAIAELRVVTPERLRVAVTLSGIRAASALRGVTGSTFSPYNVMELIVGEETSAAIRRDALCACSQCWSNVFALALNAMPARYVSDHGGILDAYRRFRGDFGDLARERVAAALSQVRANPKASCWSKFSDEALGGVDAGRTQEVPVRVSARHVHLDQGTLAALFGPGAALSRLKDLTQPGQFAANETVALVGPRGTIEKVRVLGPIRAETQVEISGTDQFSLGVEAPVRESGSLDGTPGIRLRGPAGEVTAARGVIRALRHIHMRPEDADSTGVAAGARVSVRLVGDRATIVEGVVVRVSDASALEMHIDTDEGNAAGVPAQSVGQILTPALTV